MLLAGMVSASVLHAGESGTTGVTVVVDAGQATLALSGRAFHVTDDAIEDVGSVEVGGTVVASWSQRAANGQVTPYYAVSFDGQTAAAVRETTYTLMLRYANFDPLKAVPVVERELAAPVDSRVYMVQFITQPLQAYTDVIEGLGGTVRYFLPNHAFVIEMSPEVCDALAAQPFIRWIGPYHPAYKFDAELLERFRTPGAAIETGRYNIQVLDRGMELKEIVADRIMALGGVVDVLEPDGHFLEATLTWDQLLDVIRMSETFYVDRWSPPQTFMEKVRQDGGANHVESVAGYTGAGVRAEVMDTELLVSHQAFRARPPLVHRNGQSSPHGTSVYGIVFGDGAGNANGRGMMPDAQGIFAFWSPPNRHAHTAELLQAPYFAVFQTNSWGQCCRTNYGSEAQQMDDIAFQYDFLLLQAQANNGNRSSSGHAWGKNIVSVGGIRHRDTLTRGDDAWSGSGSIGPAEDGRIKPDLAYWYDSILTTNNSGGYTSGFGGTSAATPETAGHFGLMFQMWNDGIFGNPVDPEGTVFDNRPHLATAKALMINTAEPYPFTGQGHDLTRVHQGFGLANVRNLFELRNKFFIIDETDVLANFDRTVHLVDVADNTPALKATLVYTDLAGTTSTNQHRINDLSLQVTSPSGVIYHGNVG
ncbi:MAG: peptidase S8, partial [Phycisphaerales bacterium]